jgi:Zn-dependent alcohol dehydrogenase
VGVGVTSLKKVITMIHFIRRNAVSANFACLLVNLCELIRRSPKAGSLNGTKPFLDSTVNLFFPIWAHLHFQSHIVAHRNCARQNSQKMRHSTKVCYIGCGVTTGVSAVIFTAKVEAGRKRCGV